MISERMRDGHWLQGLPCDQRIATHDPAKLPSYCPRSATQCAWHILSSSRCRRGKLPSAAQQLIFQVLGITFKNIKNIIQ